jgi:hypothetical protein
MSIDRKSISDSPGDKFVMERRLRDEMGLSGGQVAEAMISVKKYEDDRDFIVKPEILKFYEAVLDLTDALVNRQILRKDEVKMTAVSPARAAGGGPISHVHSKAHAEVEAEINRAAARMDRLGLEVHAMTSKLNEKYADPNAAEGAKGIKTRLSSRDVRLAFGFTPMA